MPKTYKVCSEGFVRKGNLIVFEDWGGFFFLSNAIRFCLRFKSQAENAYRFEMPKTYKVCGKGFVRKRNLIAFEDWGSFFFLSNAMGFCSCSRGLDENAYRFERG